MSDLLEQTHFPTTTAKNIIFLDIDGVLNCQLFYEETHGKSTFLDSIPLYKQVKKMLRKLVKQKEISDIEYYSSQICRKRVGWLNALCEETNAVIVVTSTWRMGKTIEQLQDIFNYSGATFKVISKTPRTGYERGTDISKWLHDNITQEEYGCLYFDFYRYAIIDDDSDMLLNQEQHFFQTDTYSGLTPNTCYRIKRFFLHKTF